ncbi:hypothetical protein OAN82_03975 [Pelagibacteraceae bacterium]|nr:hypothetical protein [Pelagibacteraceae bacterium]MDC1158695.1 hypothetical protein [Pelagibacteraceae bacterium]
MLKKFSLLVILTLLNGCVESMALLGPAASGAGSGKIIQSATSSVVSLSIKTKTGKSPSQHALAYIEKHNPEKKKDKCLEFIESTNTEACAAIKKNINSTKKKLADVKNSIFSKSKIEDLAKKSGLIQR